MMIVPPTLDDAGHDHARTLLYLETDGGAVPIKRASVVRSGGLR